MIEEQSFGSEMIKTNQVGELAKVKVVKRKEQNKSSLEQIRNQKF